MPDALTILAPAGIALAPNGVVLAVRTSYPTTDQEASAPESSFDTPYPIPLA